MGTTWQGDQRGQAFEEADVPLVIVDRELVIQDVNHAYLDVTLRGRDDLLGFGLVDAFPENPDLPGADGVANLIASIEAVFRHARVHRMALQRYDIRAPGPGSAYTPKYWLPVNTPLRDDAGRVVSVLHHARDVTAAVAAASDRALPSQPDMVLAHGWVKLLNAFTDEVEAHAQDRLRSEQLQVALDSRVLIEQAKGMVASRDGVSVTEAFLRMRRHARRHNASIHDVARAVVELGLVLDPIGRL